MEETTGTLTSVLTLSEERTVAACVLAFGDKQADVAAMYGVSQSTVSKICSNYKREAIEAARAHEGRTWQEQFNAQRANW